MTWYLLAGYIIDSAAVHKLASSLPEYVPIINDCKLMNTTNYISSQLDTKHVNWRRIPLGKDGDELKMGMMAVVKSQIINPQLGADARRQSEDNVRITCFCCRRLTLTV
jgi:hypothetical protein